MSTLGTRATLFAVAVLLAACGPGPLVRHEVVNQPLIDDVAGRLQAARGLRLKRPVPARMLSRDETRAWIDRAIDTGFRPGDFGIAEAVYRHLGLLWPEQSLRTLSHLLLERQIAAFYDPREKSFSIVQNPPPPQGFVFGLLRLLGIDPAGEILVAHELTHALQDQHFGIDTAPASLQEAEGDRELAHHALLEGDATLAGFACLAGGRLEGPTLDEVVRTLATVQEAVALELPDVPPVLRMPLVFGYDDGARFTARALHDGGWLRVDAVHRDPPVSTEQVLHPERYFDQRDEPRRIVIGAVPALERGGWRRVLGDTFGEFGVRILLAAAPQTQALSAAAGWDGDRLSSYRDRGGRLVSVWVSAWDSVRDAEELVAATAHLPVRPTTVERRDDTVVATFTNAAPELPPAALMRDVWRSLEIATSDPR